MATNKTTTTPKRRVSQRRRTAYHESGHAVIGRVLTLACGDASIQADHESAGHAITHQPDDAIAAWQECGKVRGE